MKKATRESQLLKISEEIEACVQCREGKLGRAVAGEGSAYAEIAFIGEAPGKEEAKVGPAFHRKVGEVSPVDDPGDRPGGKRGFHHQPG